MRGDRDSSSLWIPVITTEDSQPEHDETFSIGFFDDNVWHPCVITIADDDAPEVTSVELTSVPVDGDTYRDNESIDVTVTLDQEVEVEGTPLLSLYIGDGSDSTWRGARYYTGSGGKYLVFRYQVQAADRDTDGVSVSSARADENHNPASGFSGKINAKGTDVPIEYTHGGGGTSPAHKVDGRPYAQSTRVISAPPGEWTAYRANQVIEISRTFNTDVLVEGDVRVSLWVGYESWGDFSRSWREAQYLGGSATDTLVFGYTVAPGDMDPLGIMVGYGSFGGAGTIKADGTAFDRDRHYAGTDHLPGHKVDAVAPSVETVSFESHPANGDAYAAGEVVSVEVTFSEPVTISGDLQLDLDVGGVARQAALRTETSQGSGRSFGGTAVFQYEVQDGDNDLDGIGISANSLRLNGGSIHDRAGNAAGLSHAVVVADSGQRVDTSPEH